MADNRKFDSLDRTVRDLRRKLDDTASTVLARLGGHTHAGVDHDVEITDASKGVILTDRVTGTRYRLRVSSGTLSIEAV